jgi:hypothetical protein
MMMHGSMNITALHIVIRMRKFRFPSPDPSNQCRLTNEIPGSRRGHAFWGVMKCRLVQTLHTNFQLSRSGSDYLCIVYTYFPDSLSNQCSLIWFWAPSDSRRHLMSLPFAGLSVQGSPFDVKRGLSPKISSMSNADGTG